MDVRTHQEGAQPELTTTLSWRTLLAGIAAVSAVGYFVYSATIHEFPPAGFAYGLLLLLAAWRVRRSGSRMAIGGAGLLHAFELFNVLFVYGNPQMVMNPGAWQDFLVGVFFIVANAAGLVAAVAAWRERQTR
jgi:hypothetical protein